MKIRTLLLFVLFIGQISNANTVIVTDPVIPFLSNLYACDNSGNSTFDLTVQTPIILSSQSGSASDYSVTYHITLTDANSGANSFNNSANYFYQSNPQTIYVRVQNNTTSSFATGSFTIEVFLQQIPVFNQIAPLCQNSIAPNLPSTSADGIIGT